MRTTITILAASAVVTVATAVTASAVRDDHVPDPKGFREAVVFQVGGWSSSRDPRAPKRDMAWTISHLPQVEAAGQRACDWKAAQPTDLTVSDLHGVPSVAPDVVDVLPAMPLSESARFYVVTTAWEYLCP